MAVVSPARTPRGQSRSHPAAFAERYSAERPREGEGNMTALTAAAKASGEFALGGTVPVTRLGYGTMQLPGPRVWGEPADPDEAVRVLRRAVDLGVTFIDTADSYGPAVAERLVRKALHPYPDDLVIATKARLTPPGPGAGVTLCPPGDPPP